MALKDTQPARRKKRLINNKKNNKFIKQEMVEA